MSSGWDRAKINVRYRVFCIFLWIPVVTITYALKPSSMEINTVTFSSDIMWAALVTFWTWAMTRLYGFMKSKTPQDVTQIGKIIHEINLKIDTVQYDIKTLHEKLDRKPVEVKTT